jgi:hypothetical protein
MIWKGVYYIWIENLVLGPNFKRINLVPNTNLSPKSNCPTHFQVYLFAPCIVLDRIIQHNSTCCANEIELNFCFPCFTCFTCSISISNPTPWIMFNFNHNVSSKLVNVRWVFWWSSLQQFQSHFQIIIHNKSNSNLESFLVVCLCTLSTSFFWGVYLYLILLWTYLMNRTFIAILPTKSRMWKK